MAKLGRRRFLGLALLAAAGLGACSSGSSPRTLNILNWADYLHPDAISEFERRYQVKVVYDTFASNEALLAKLQAGGSRYDVIVPSSYMVKQLHKLDLLAELDHERIKGLNGLLPRFLNAAYDPGLKHCVPYTWGTTGIGFSESKLADCGLKIGRAHV